MVCATENKDFINWKFINTWKAVHLISFHEQFVRNNTTREREREKRININWTQSSSSQQAAGLGLSLRLTYLPFLRNALWSDPSFSLLVNTWKIYAEMQLNACREKTSRIIMSSQFYFNSINDQKKIFYDEKGSSVINALANLHFSHFRQYLLSWESSSALLCCCAAAVTHLSCPKNIIK